MFAAPLSPVFYALYTYCGISDMLDGLVARRTKTESNLGAVLDSVADALFLLISLIKLLPVLLEQAPVGVLQAALFIALVRILAYVVGFFKYRRYAPLHTYLNKATGFVLFCLPYFILLPQHDLFYITLCLLAGISALEELVITITAKTYDPNRKSLRNK